MGWAAVVWGPPPLLVRSCQVKLWPPPADAQLVVPTTLWRPSVDEAGERVAAAHPGRPSPALGRTRRSRGTALRAAWGPRASKVRYGPATQPQPRPPSHGLHCRSSSLRVYRRSDSSIPVCCSLTSRGRAQGCWVRGFITRWRRVGRSPGGARLFGGAVPRALSAILPTMLCPAAGDGELLLLRAHGVPTIRRPPRGWGAICPGRGAHALFRVGWCRSVGVQGLFPAPFGHAPSARPFPGHGGVRGRSKGNRPWLGGRFRTARAQRTAGLLLRRGGEGGEGVLDPKLGVPKMA